MGAGVFRMRAMRRWFAFLVLVPGCSSAPAPASREDFLKLFNDYVAERARLDPVWATRVGIHQYDDRMTRHDDASYLARRGLTERTLAALRALDLRGLEPQDAVDARLFEAQLAVEAFDYARRDYRTVSPDLPLGAIGGVHELLIKDFAPKETRVAAATARLRQVGLVCADARVKLDRPPKLWTEMAIDDVQGALEFLKELPNLGDVPEEALQSARTAFAGYHEWLKLDLLPRSTGSIVYGRDAFEFRLQKGHLLAYTADTLAAVGRREFERTEDMLVACAKSIDPKRDWKAILEEMMGDHPKKEALLETYRAEIARARQYMIDKAIVGIPDERLELVETPGFMQSTVPFAAYNMPAPLDQSRLGIFYVTPEPEGHFMSDIPGTVWHEAYPGHHLQFVYAKDVPSVVRRLNDSPLLSEGWGFYCEELAHETGYYDDPRERLMQLNWRLQRAARIILDVGVHTGKIPYDEAVKFLVERVRMRQGQAEGSVKGYSQSPTYFSCYMVGMLEIVRIREKLRARLGARFTLKEFHERVLRCGNVPPALIESELDRTWR